MQSSLPRLSRAVLAAFVAIAAPALALEPGAAEGWRWHSFGTGDGLPGERIQIVAESSDGTPWVSTDAGLAWFDGWTWHAVGSDQGASSRGVSSFSGTQDGPIVAQDNRVRRWNGERFVEIDLTLDGASLEVSRVVPVDRPWLGRGYLAIARRPTDIPDPVSNFLVLADGKGVHLVERPDDTIVSSLRGTPSGAWLETARGLYFVGPTGFELVLPMQRCCREITHFATNARGDGILAVNFPPEERGIWEWTAGGPMKLDEAAGSLRVGGLDIDEDGTALVVFQGGGAWRREGGEWSEVSDLPLPLTDASCVLVHGRDAWVGTGSGLYRYRGSSTRWTSWRYPLPTTRNRVHDFLRAADGSLWVATGAGVEIRRQDGSVEWIDKVAGTPLLDVTGIAQDVAGNVWIVSGNAFTGAWRFDGREWRHVGAAEGFTPGLVHSVRRDPAGDLWFLTLTRTEDHDFADGDGAYRLHDGVFEHWDESHGFPAGRVYCFAQGPHGERWFTLSTGVARFADGKWKTWGRDDGVEWPRLTALAVDGSGRAWFGGQAQGLGVIDTDDRVHYLHAADGLVDDAVSGLAMADDGWLWIATQNGLAAYQDGRWMRFTWRSGLPQGRLWPVRVEGRRVFVGTTAVGVAILDLDADAGELPRIDVAAETRDGDGPETVHARWKVLPWWGEEPGDAYLTRWRADGGAWTPWSLDREAEAPARPRGRQTIEVQALGIHGDLTDPAEATVDISPQASRNPAVVIPLGVLGLAVIALSVILLVRRGRYVETLRRSEGRFRQIFESASDLLCTLDSEGRILAVNTAGERLLGKEAADVVGTPLAQWIDEEHRLALGDALQRARLIAPAVATELDVETVVARVPLELGIRIIQGSDGATALLIGRDVSARRAAEAERLRVERQILEGQRLEGIGQLAGGIAHDFNNLLMAILGSVESLQGQLPASGAAHRSLDVIEKASRRAADLTQQLVAHAGKAPRRVEPLDVGSLVRDMSALFLSALPRTVELVLDVASGVPAVEADVSQLRQAVLNLVRNAGEAIAEAGVVTIGVREVVVEGEPWVELSVGDTGRGIEEAVKPRIFDPFFTTQFAGRGLGLAAVHGIVRSHRGTIAVETDLGRGTTFRVRLPATSRRPALQQAVETATRSGGRGQLILVVDDDDAVRSLVAAALEADGFVVLQASDAVFARALFAKHADAIGAVVLDVLMPGMRGDALLVELRRMRPRIPALLMSGHDEDAVRDRTTADAPFLGKPFSVKALVAMVERLTT